jgi:threonine-phosphate decarboxylase
MGCLPEEIVDMSSNINPLGPLPGLLEHLKKKMGAVRSLPQVDAAAASRAYAGLLGLPPDRVLAGAGTTQLLYQIPAALKLSSAVIVSPTYADYADALSLNGVPHRRFLLAEEDGFRPDLERLRHLAGTVDAVYICNPNNPTGGFTPIAELERLAAACPSTRFIVDESYLPFVSCAGRDSLAFRGLSNVLVLRSLSKMYAVPGLRIGFLVAAPEMAETIARRSPPWSVNALAQEAASYIAGQASLAGEHAEKTRAYLERERAMFAASVDGAPGVRTYPASGTYMLLRLDGERSRDLSEHLLKKRILIRDCANFHGLSDRFARISFKKREDNRMAAELVREFAERGVASKEKAV